MKEKFDELYQEYLNEKLNMIFSYNGEKKDSNNKYPFKVIEKDGEYNVLNKNGTLLSDEWFYEIYNFINGRAVVERNRELNFIEWNPMSVYILLNIILLLNVVNLYLKNGRIILGTSMHIKLMIAFQLYQNHQEKKRNMNI